MTSSGLPQLPVPDTATCIVIEGGPDCTHSACLATADQDQHAEREERMRLTPEGLWAYVAERVAIRDRRRRGEPPPWTTDEALATFHFPNVHREDDLGTRYFHEQVAGSPPGRVLWYSVVYRLLNRIDTFERHGGLLRVKPTERAVARWLDELEADLAARLPIATGRHFVPGFRRYRESLPWLLEHLTETTGATLGAYGTEEACRAVQRIPHVGTFFGWQVTCDLLEARAVPFDEDDWADFGPGAANALHMMESGALCDDYTWGQPPGPKRVQELRPYAAELVARQDEHLPADFGGPRVTLKNLEHALCEYLRYVRIGVGFYAKGGRRSWT